MSNTPTNSQQLIAELMAKNMLGQQFQEILALKSRSNPTFVVDMVRLYISNAGQKLMDIERLLLAQQIDEGSLDHAVHQLKGSSATLGADGVVHYCISLRDASRDRDYSQGRRIFMELKAYAHNLLVQLQLLADLEYRGLAGGPRP